MIFARAETRHKPIPFIGKSESGIAPAVSLHRGPRITLESPREVGSPENARQPILILCNAVVQMDRSLSLPGKSATRTSAEDLHRPRWRTGSPETTMAEAEGYAGRSC